MAESQGNDKRLKHLNFVSILAVNMVVLLSNLYECAKQNSGPLRTSVGKVESTVKAVVEPVYDRFKGIPSHFLVFLDGKVDVLISKFDEHAPRLAKKLVSKAHIAIIKASHITKQLMNEAQTDGTVAALIHASQISKQFAVDQLPALWYKLNTFPPLHGVTQMALPTATYWSEMYNKLVTELKRKGYTIFYYAPLIPVEEIAKAYKQVETSTSKKTDATSWSETECKPGNENAAS